VVPHFLKISYCAEKKKKKTIKNCRDSLGLDGGMPTFEHFPIADIVKEGVERADGCGPPPLSAFLPPDYTADDDDVVEGEENSDDSDYYDYVQPTQRPPLVFPSTLTANAASGAVTQRSPTPPRQPPPPPPSPWAAELAPLPPVKAAPVTANEGFVKPAGFPAGLFGAAFGGADPFSHDFFQKPDGGNYNRQENRKSAASVLQQPPPPPPLLRPTTSRFDSFESSSTTDSSEEEEEEEEGEEEGEDSSRYEPVPLNDSPPNSLSNNNINNNNRKSLINSGPYPFYAPDIRPSELLNSRGVPPANVLPPPLPPPGNFPGAGLTRADNGGRPFIKPAGMNKKPGGLFPPKLGPLESLMGPIRNIFSGGNRQESLPPPRGPSIGTPQDIRR
jgi:hypothetical protein